jgi:PAS domain S-box-containing protein
MANMRVLKLFEFGFAPLVLINAFFIFHISKLTGYQWPVPMVLLVICVNIGLIAVWTMYARLYSLRLRDVNRSLSNVLARFDGISTGTRVGTYEWDLKTGRIFLNPMFKRMLGYSSEELLSIPYERFYDMIHVESRVSFDRGACLFLYDNIPFNLEFRMQCKDGGFVWVIGTASVIFDDQGKPGIWVGTVISAEHKKKSEEQIVFQNEQLVRVNSELELILYRLSHDVRSPISSILGLVHLAKNSELEEWYQYLNHIEDRAKALDYYIKEVVSYPRSNSTSGLKEPINLKKMVVELFESLMFNSQARQVQLIPEIDNDLIVYSDKLTMSIVLNNLILNALSNTDPAKGTKYVKVTAVVLVNKWELIVEDNGVGIEEAHHNLLFDMFYKVDKGSESAGLGLFLVKQSVQKLGGQLFFDSIPQIGTTISIQFDYLNENMEFHRAMAPREKYMDSIML